MVGCNTEDALDPCKFIENPIHDRPVNDNRKYPYVSLNVEAHGDHDLSLEVDNRVNSIGKSNRSLQKVVSMARAIMDLYLPRAHRKRGNLKGTLKLHNPPGANLPPMGDKQRKHLGTS